MCHDSQAMGWGDVSDIAMAQDQLVSYFSVSPYSLTEHLECFDIKIVCDKLLLV